MIKRNKGVIKEVNWKLCNFIEYLKYNTEELVKIFDNLKFPDQINDGFKKQFSQEVFKNIFNATKRTELSMNESSTLEVKVASKSEKAGILFVLPNRWCLRVEEQQLARQRDETQEDDSAHWEPRPGEKQSPVWERTHGTTAIQGRHFERK